MAVASSITSSLLIPASALGGLHAHTTGLIFAGIARSIAAASFSSLYASAVLLLVFGIVPCLALGFMTAFDFIALVILLVAVTASTRKKMVEEREMVRALARRKQEKLEN